MDNFFTKLISYLKGEISQLEAEASALEKKILPGVEAAAHNAVKIFGEQALPIIEQLGAALIAALEAGGNVGVVIPQLVNDAIKDLAPDAIAAGKNVLYTSANLVLAQFLTSNPEAAISATSAQTDNAANAGTEEKAAEDSTNTVK